MALGLDGDALDRSRYEGSRQRLSTTEGSQATSSLTCRSARTPEQKLTRHPCSPSQRRLTSISAATASQCSTMSGTSPLGDVARISVIGRPIPEIAAGLLCTTGAERTHQIVHGVRAHWEHERIRPVLYTLRC